MEPVPPFALVDGSFIFLAFVVILLFGVVFGYYSRSGTDIGQQPFDDRGAADPDSFRDTSQVVANWSRGTGGHRHRRNRPAAPAEVSTPLDPQTTAALKAWRERVDGDAPSGLVAEPDHGRDHTRGSAAADVTVVAYGDFQCPSCQAADWEVRKLQDELGSDRLRYVFRHFPVADAHPGALDAAQAAEHASLRDRFWDMHDAIYRSPRRPDRTSLTAAARKVGIDAEELIEVLDRRPYASRIAEDFDTGVRSGVDGVPTLFINGVRHDDDMDRKTLGDAVQAALTARPETTR